MNVQQMVSYCSTGIIIFGAVMNIIFIYVIRNGTRTCVGRVYKNIMTCFAVCNIGFIIMEFIAKPGIHIYGTSIAVVSNGIFQRVKPWGFLSLCVFLGMYGVTTALLAFHFVYRYIVVCKPHLLRIFHEPVCIVTVTVCVLSWGSAYGIITFYCFASSDNYYNYANASIYAKFGVDANRLSYFCVFTHEVKEDVTIINWPSTIGLFIVFIMMVFTFALMIFCGFQMYRTLKKSSMSRKSMKLQTQLLKALVVQVGLFMMICLFFVFEEMYSGSHSFFHFIFITNRDVHKRHYGASSISVSETRIYSFTPLFLTIYTVMDPIAIMLFVCDYRQVVGNLRKHVHLITKVAAKLFGKSVVAEGLSPSTTPISKDYRTGWAATTAFY
ncbi:7TM chemoreceptor, partial [Ostertagia ostertagi]